jgi:hypothetical protein
MNPHQLLLDKLAEVAKLSPDVRFGQLLANVGLLAEDRTDQSLWDTGDAELLNVLEGHRSDLAARLSPQPFPQQASVGRD